MAEDATVLEGTVQWMELLDDDEQPIGVAILIGEQDLLSLLGELEGRRLRVTIEVLGDPAEE